MARTPVLPEPTAGSTLSALLRHSRLRIPGEPGVDNGDIFYSLRIARDQIRRLSDGRPHRQRQGSTPHPATAAAFAKLPVKITPKASAISSPP